MIVNHRNWRLSNSTHGLRCYLLISSRAETPGCGESLAGEFHEAIFGTAANLARVSSGTTVSTPTPRKETARP